MGYRVRLFGQAGPKTAICVAGWHFNEEFYYRVSRLPQAEVFVVSHRPPEAVPPYVFDHIPSGNIFFESNLGYDWGSYQQFLEKRLWCPFDYIFFMHDDVVIKDERLVSQCIELLKLYSVVGNGRALLQKERAGKHSQSYAHSSWKPPTRDFRHDVLRGSFFSTTRQALEQLGKFEVFWDRLHLSSGFGNWSTRASCARWEYAIEEDCFGFLSETYCESDFLKELVRGGNEAGINHIEPPKARKVSFIQKVSEFYMSVHWKEQYVPMRHVILGLLTPYIRHVSGR